MVEMCKQERVRKRWAKEKTDRRNKERKNEAKRENREVQYRTDVSVKKRSLSALAVFGSAVKCAFLE